MWAEELELRHQRKPKSLKKIYILNERLDFKISTFKERWKESVSIMTLTLYVKSIII